MLNIGRPPSTAMISDSPLTPALFTPALLCALALTLSAAPICAQTSGSDQTQQVSYWNPQDSIFLTASLTLPPGSGPHPGVVVLSGAGTVRLVDRFVADDYAVLIPVPRGFVTVEPLLRATYSDLAGDVQAALDYLGSRAEVNAEALALVAQADVTPAAILSSVSSEEPVPLVLLAPSAFPGVETFRLQQRGLAERGGAGAAHLQALDQYVARLGEIVLGESTSYLREYRLKSLRAGSTVQLPRNNAAFPSDERQAHFFASPLWRDQLAFEPEIVLALLGSPILVLIGTEDPNTPMDEYLAAVRRGLSNANTRDATVCVMPGRTRHTFTEEGVTAIADWLAERIVSAAETNASNRGTLPSCLEDPVR
jgi:pimeloyl-ACP methyl ester carboxylesterase